MWNAINTTQWIFNIFATILMKKLVAKYVPIFNYYKIICL